jgi:hypothetical protein
MADLVADKAQDRAADKRSPERGASRPTSLDCQRAPASSSYDAAKSAVARKLWRDKMGESLVHGQDNNNIVPWQEESLAGLLPEGMQKAEYSRTTSAAR